MNFQQLNGVSIPDAFTQFDRENPRVWAAFERQATLALEKGATKISSKAIINWLRWEMFIQTTDQNFKINDAFTPHYGRKYVRLHPEHEDKFEFRRLRTEENPPYMNVNEEGQVTFL